MRDDGPPFRAPRGSRSLRQPRPDGHSRRGRALLLASWAAASAGAYHAPTSRVRVAVVSGVLCRRRPERVERLFIDACFATPPPRRVEVIDEPRCTPTVLARVVRDNRAGCDSWWHCWLGQIRRPREVASTRVQGLRPSSTC